MAEESSNPQQPVDQPEAGVQATTTTRTGLSEILGSDLKEALKGLPPETQERIASQISRRVFYAEQTSLYRGPIPPASELGKYEKFLPGAADRILKLAEKQSDHRISIEADTISSQQQQALRGQWMAFFIAIYGISAAVVAALMGHPVVGGVIGGGTLTSIVTVFLVSKQARHEDLASKRELMPAKTKPAANSEEPGSA